MKLKIDEKRKKRYLEKLLYSKERFMDLEEWIDEKDKKSVLASEKSFQEGVESIIDIFSMLIVDLGLVISDDYANIEKLIERKIIASEQGKVITEANGLRNIVVHKYNGVNEKIFVENAKILLPSLNNFIEDLKKYIIK